MRIFPFYYFFTRDFHWPILHFIPHSQINSMNSTKSENGKTRVATRRVSCLLLWIPVRRCIFWMALQFYKRSVMGFFFCFMSTIGDDSFANYFLFQRRQGIQSPDVNAFDPIFCLVCLILLAITMWSIIRTNETYLLNGHILKSIKG